MCAKPRLLSRETFPASQLRRAEVLPVPLRTLLIDDCIDNGVEYYRGGARYKWSIINFAGNINVVDSMLTIKDMIFDRKVITPEEMISKLRNNDKEFLAECRKEPLCFGTCDSEVNKFAHRLTNDIYSTLDDLKPAIGEAFIPASIQFESHAKAGRDVGATRTAERHIHRSATRSELFSERTGRDRRLFSGV